MLEMSQYSISWYDLLSRASRMFQASNDDGPPRIQVICPDGPVTYTMAASG
jgi:hypothetical protein